MVNTTIDEFVRKKLHLSHPTRDWNPKMAPYIYTKRKGFYIIDLLSTYSCLQETKKALRDAAEKNLTFLFVGTKKQASPLVKYYAQQCNAFYINYKWAGGLLTNWQTVSAMTNALDSYSSNNSQEKLLPSRSATTTTPLASTLHSKQSFDRTLTDEFDGLSVQETKAGLKSLVSTNKTNLILMDGKGTHQNMKASATKKEVARIKKKRQKLERMVGGIREMKKLPDMVIIIGAAEEQNAVKECKKLGIPIVTILDTNCDPRIATWGVPANDDSVTSIDTILREFSNAIISGESLSNKYKS